jgi:hypothetical protein
MLYQICPHVVGIDKGANTISGPVFEALIIMIINGQTVSLRSKPACPVDLSKLAKLLGGGGHQRSGGFSLDVIFNKKEIVDRYVDVFDVMPENISSSVLVISINPSSSDLDNNQEPSPCYLHFIPDEIKALRTDLKPILNTWNGDKFGKKLCYPGYFRRIYKIFQNTDYYPLFVNKEYNDNWINALRNSTSYRHLLSEEDLIALRALENRCLTKSIIISDLIPLKETDSSKVNLIINDPEVRGLIIELLEKKIKFLKPDFALIIFKRLQKDLMGNIQSLFSEARFDDNKLEGRETYFDKTIKTHCKTD